MKTIVRDRDRDRDHNFRSRDQHGLETLTSLPRPLLAVPNVTAHPSTASVPITVALRF